MRQTKQKVFLAMLVCMFALTACSKRGKCDSCGQTETLKKYEARDGNTYYYCDDCISYAKLFGF